MNRVVLFSVMVVIAAAAGRSVVHSATTNRQIACPISPTSAVSRPSPIQVDRSKTRSRRGMLVVIDPGHGELGWIKCAAVESNGAAIAVAME